MPEMRSIVNKSIRDSSGVTMIDLQLSRLSRTRAAYVLRCICLYFFSLCDRTVPRYIVAFVLVRVAVTTLHEVLIVEVHPDAQVRSCVSCNA